MPEVAPPTLPIPPCALCGHVDQWNGLVAPPGRKAITGDFIICRECCRLNVLVVGDDGSHSFRAPTDQEMAQIRRDKELVRRVNKAILDAEAARFMRKGGLR